LQASTIKLGEQMKEYAPIFAEIEAQIKLTIAEMAAWAIRNPEFTAAIIVGILAIRSAFLALKASNPVGWIMAAVEGAIALVMLLIGIFEDQTKAMLESTQKMKRMSETRLADVRAAKEQAEAELEVIRNAKTTGKILDANIKTISNLKRDIKLLVAEEWELIKTTNALASACLDLQNAVTVIEFAEEIGSGNAAAVDLNNAVITGEELIRKQALAWQEILKTQEDMREVEAGLRQLTRDIVMAGTDEEKLRKAIIKHLTQQVGLTEEEADKAVEHGITLDEALAYQNGITTTIKGRQEYLNQEAINAKDMRFHLYEQRGLQKAIKLLKGESVELTEEDVKEQKKKVIEIGKELLALAQKNVLIMAGLNAGWGYCGSCPCCGTKDI